MSRYFTVLFLSGIVPFVLSFYPPLKFWRNARALISTISLILLIFGAWDVLATFRGHWRFESSGIYGLYILNLPAEEVLFFVVITFCCLFTWETLKFLKEHKN